jgi:hypothetical protein
MGETTNLSDRPVVDAATEPSRCGCAQQRTDNIAAEVRTTANSLAKEPNCTVKCFLNKHPLPAGLFVFSAALILLLIANKTA